MIIICHVIKFIYLFLKNIIFRVWPKRKWMNPGFEKGKKKRKKIFKKESLEESSGGEVVTNLQDGYLN